MENAIKTIGCVVIEPKTGRNLIGECIEIYRCKIPEGSNAFLFNGSNCITFAVLDVGDINSPLGGKYNPIPAGAKEVYIPDLKNKKNIYFI